MSHGPVGGVSPRAAHCFKESDGRRGKKTVISSENSSQGSRHGGKGKENVEDTANFNVQTLFNAKEEAPMRPPLPQYYNSMSFCSPKPSPAMAKTRVTKLPRVKSRTATASSWYDAAGHSREWRVARGVIVQCPWCLLRPSGDLATSSAAAVGPWPPSSVAVKGSVMPRHARAWRSKAWRRAQVTAAAMKATTPRT